MVPEIRFDLRRAGGVIVVKAHVGLAVTYEQLQPPIAALRVGAQNGIVALLGKLTALDPGHDGEAAILQLQHIGIGQLHGVVLPIELGGQAHLPLHAGFGTTVAGTTAIMIPVGTVVERTGPFRFVEMQLEPRRGQVEKTDFVDGEGFAVNAHIVQPAVEIEVRTNWEAADHQVAGTLIVGRSSILRHLHVIAVDRPLAAGGVVGTRPVMPILIGIRPRGIQVVPPESAGEAVVVPEPELQAVVCAATSLADYHVVAAGGVPFGPGRQSEGSVLHIHRSGVHVVVVAIEESSLVGTTGDAAGGAGTGAARAIALAGDVGNVGEALSRKAGAGRLVEGEVQGDDVGLVERLHFFRTQSTLVDGKFVHLALEGDRMIFERRRVLIAQPNISLRIM